MKILIVDDEMMIKEWLSITISSLPFSSTTIETASNGQEALQKIENTNFDLILIDVMMPKMNGLELLKRVNEKNIDAMLVVLSSHDEFKFAKEAIKYNVKEYILKNECSKEKLIEILQECEEGIEHKKKASGMNEDLLCKAIRGNVSLAGDSIITGLFPAIEGQTLFVGLYKEHENTIIRRYEYENVIVRMIGLIGRTDDYTFTLFSLESVNGDSNYTKVKEQFAIVLADHIGSKVSFGRFFQSVKGVLGECRNSWIGYQNLFYDSARSVSGPNHYRQLDTEQVDDLCDNVLSAIRFYDKEKTLTHLEALNSYFQVARATDVDEVIHIYLSVLSTFIIYNNKKSRRLTEKLESLRNTVQSFESFSTLSEWILQIVENNAELMSRNRYSIAVENALEYIEEHYQSIGSVAEIAEHVNLSLDYFSRHFKKEVGVTLNSYLINFRLDKASVILLSSNLSVQEVAKKVGIESGSYFSKCFKKKFHTQPIRFKIQTVE